MHVEPQQLHHRGNAHLNNPCHLQNKHFASVMTAPRNLSTEPQPRSCVYVAVVAASQLRHRCGRRAWFDAIPGRNSLGARVGSIVINQQLRETARYLETAHPHNCPVLSGCVRFCLRNRAGAAGDAVFEAPRCGRLHRRQPCAPHRTRLASRIRVGCKVFGVEKPQRVLNQ